MPRGQLTVAVRVVPVVLRLAGVSWSRLWFLALRTQVPARVAVAAGVAAIVLDRLTDIPLWVVGLSGLAMSIGTYAGGWRIMRTLGSRIVPLTPPQGFAAETAAAITLAIATALRAPISTTYTITSGIIGVGTATNSRAVRWDVGRDILTAWLLTLPGAALAAAASAWLFALA